ncbi:MAG: IS66 family insertion sequence element accessory protein TnpA [Phocaeicola sp.]
MVYWNLAYFNHLYEQYTCSGISVRAFCDSQGIKENRFYYWIHKLKLNAVPDTKAPKEFIPLTSQGIKELPGGFLPVKRSEPHFAKSSHLKLTYPNGVVMEFTGEIDMELIKPLITLTL